MSADKPRKNESVTRTTEYGYYIRKKFRKGKKRRQKTVRIKKNPEKVILGKIGDIEVYAYPYQFPDRVFLGIFPLSTYIEEHQKEDILVLYNKIRWFFEEHWTNERAWTKASKRARHSIQRAYNSGLDKVKEAKS